MTTESALLDYRIINNGEGIATNTAAIAELGAGLTANPGALGAIEGACQSPKADIFYPTCQDIYDDIYDRLETGAEGVSSNAAAIEMNTEGVLAAAATNFGSDVPTELLFPFEPGFSMTISPGQIVNGDDGSAFSGNLYRSVLRLDIAGTDDDSVLRMELFGVAIGLNPTDRSARENLAGTFVSWGRRTTNVSRRRHPVPINAMPPSPPGCHNA